MTNNMSGAIDRILAACNGDLRGAVKALLLVNEALDAELAQLYVGRRCSFRERADRILLRPF